MDLAHRGRNIDLPAIVAGNTPLCREARLVAPVVLMVDAECVSGWNRELERKVLGKNLLKWLR